MEVKPTLPLPEEENREIFRPFLAVPFTKQEDEAIKSSISSSKNNPCDYRTSIEDTENHSSRENHNSQICNWFDLKIRQYKNIQLKRHNLLTIPLKINLQLLIRWALSQFPPKNNNNFEYRPPEMDSRNIIKS